MEGWAAFASELHQPSSASSSRALAACDDEGDQSQVAAKSYDYDGTTAGNRRRMHAFVREAFEGYCFSVVEINGRLDVSHWPYKRKPVFKTQSKHKQVQSIGTTCAKCGTRDVLSENLGR